MAEFRLSYNPFTVETVLSVKMNNTWHPVSEESGLLRVSKMRMQRWLDKSYFDELREAVGENEIDIYFSGTKEDMADLQQAALTYSAAHDDVRISVWGTGDVERNSSKSKLTQLSNILKGADRSAFKALLPDDVWIYLNDCLNPSSAKTLRISFADWQSFEGNIFSPGAWQMICLDFPYERMRKKEMRELFRSFAKALEAMSDRRFDRERFLFICHDALVTPYLENDVRKMFMEYGMQDLYAVALCTDELERLDDFSYDAPSQELQEVRQCIVTFNERYAEQYRLRKMHDTAMRMLRDQGIVNGPKLFRKVDDTLRGHSGSAKHITDETVSEAFRWVTGFQDQIEHLLDIDTDG